MKDLESLAADFFSNLGIQTQGAKFILGLSGGLDSMVLAYIMKKLGAQIIPVHCNFDLRTEAGADERFVNSTMKTWGLQIHSQKFDTRAFASEHNCSVQVAARHLRYDFFDTVAENEKADGILTAHHADDQTETLLLYLIRSRSPDLFRGIPLSRGNIYRPLLSVRKSEIQQYALEHKIPWVEDISNRRNDYLRNRIRNQVIPLIEETNPAFSELLVERNNLYQKQIHLLDKLLQEVELNYFTQNEKGAIFNIEPAAKLLGKEGIEIALGRILMRLGWENALIPQVVELLFSETGKRIQGKFGIALKDRNRILIETAYEGNAFKMNISKSQANGLSVDLENTKMSIHKIEGKPSVFNPLAFYLDGEKLKFPLIVRHWFSGDKMVPLGMNHPKKLSDIFADEKVSVLQKEKMWVLADQEEIVALMGFRIAETRKIQDSTPYYYEVIFS